jgi:hypothetical protein
MKMFIVWLLPLHGFSGIRQVHLNAVFIFVCLQTHPLKHARFPQISVNCEREKRGDLKPLCFHLQTFIEELQTEQVLYDKYTNPH